MKIKKKKKKIKIHVVNCLFIEFMMKIYFIKNKYLYKKMRIIKIIN